MKKPQAAVRVKVARLAHAEGLPLPTYQSEHAAGLDLVAANPASAPVTITPGRHVMVPTGLTFELPPGTEAQIRPRSGLAAKFAVTVLNSPGTIDADYRGEVQILLINHGTEPFVVNRGDRIAQMVIAKITHATIIEAKKPLTITKRGSGGFGSTGVAHAAQKKKPISQPAASTKLRTRGKHKRQKS